jgi:hypothetical protein
MRWDVEVSSRQGSFGGEDEGKTTADDAPGCFVSDNNEYLLHNDEYVPAWDEDSKKTNAFKGKINVGTLGRMYNVSKKNRYPYDPHRKSLIEIVSFRPN